MHTGPSSVFITGATGFIGKHLSLALLGQEIGVRAMIRPGKETDDRLPPGCGQVPVGLTDVDTLAGIVAESRAVIYCAGSVRGRNFTDFSVANIDGVKAMVRALDTLSKPPPLLLLSSLAASRPHLSDYARSKCEGEQVLHSRDRLSWTVLRPPAVYGPGDREMLPLLRMARRGLLVHAGPRDQRLSLLHVGDLAGAMLAWLAAVPKCLHRTFAIDDGRTGGYDWAAIGEAAGAGKFRMLKAPRLMLDTVAGINLLFSSVLGYAPMLTPGKVRELVQPDWLCDNSNFTTATGWKPELELSRGIQQLFDTTNKHPPH